MKYADSDDKKVHVHSCKDDYSIVYKTRLGNYKTLFDCRCNICDSMFTITCSENNQNANN